MQDDSAIKEAEARVKSGSSTPITYYYNPALNLSGEICYINVYQCLHDKFMGRITQGQFFVVAEQTQRIFALNRKHIETAILEARKRPNYQFAVQVSSKWFEKDSQTKELETLISCAPDNVIICFDTQSLANTNGAREKLCNLINSYNLKLMLDNPEEEKLSMLFDYHISYLRLDGSYYRDKTSTKSAYLRIYSEFAKAQQIAVIVANVDTDEDKVFFKNAGISMMEGNAIAGYKTKVVAITAPYEMKN